jgi:hypothetical protein
MRMIITTLTNSMTVLQVYILDFMRVVASVSVVTMTMLVSGSISMSMSLKYLPKSMPFMSVSVPVATDFNVDSFGMVTVFDKFWHIDFEVHTEKLYKYVSSKLT